jgi:hypothetical protein
VLDGASARHHEAWIGVNPGLHSIERSVVEEPVDRSLGAGRASLLKPARLARRGPIADTIARVLAGRSKCLAGRAAGRVRNFVIGELNRPEVLGVHRAVLDGCGDLNVVALAFGDRLSVE